MFQTIFKLTLETA